jgi:hypothetical protein
MEVELQHFVSLIVISEPISSSLSVNFPSVSVIDENVWSIKVVPMQLEVVLIVLDILLLSERDWGLLFTVGASLPFVAKVCPVGGTFRALITK